MVGTYYSENKVKRKFDARDKRKGNLRSGQVLAVLICSQFSLMQSGFPAGILCTKRNENGAWSQVREKEAVVGKRKEIL